MTNVLPHRKLQSFSRPGETSAATAKSASRNADVSGAANVPAMEAPVPDAAPQPLPTARTEPIEQRRAEKPAEATATKAAGKPSSRKRLLLGAAGIAALIAGSWYGYHYVTVGQYIVSTDDAYVGADMAIISPKVAAYVAEVPIVENQHVKAGDLLVQLDDGDYKLAVDQAATKLATQKAQLQTFDAQNKAAEATASQARSQLESYNASLVKAEADFVRTDQLAARDFSPKASLDAARAARDSARAQVAAGKSAIQTADANVAVLKAQRQEAERVVKELEVALAKAERDLSFTNIRAPFNGVIGNKSVQVGDYVTPGKRIAAVVPLDKVYVDANLKETQLAHVHPGEPAAIRVDALGGAAIEGTVESVSPASGSQFSLLPPENATGNFTKIVQRVPVRIAVPADKADGKLRPGLSVIVDINTKGAAGKQASVAAN